MILGLSVLRDKSNQPKQVSSETRDIRQNAVKPFDMQSSIFDYQPNVYHGKQGTNPYNTPYPFAEKQVTGRDRKYHKCRVYHDLYFGKRKVADLADGYWDTFTGHCYRPAFYFKRDTDTHDGTSGQLGENLHDQGIAQEEICQPHIEVDQPSEDETDDELEKLDQFKSVSENKYLAYDEDKVHQNRIGSNRPGRDETDRTGQRQDIRQWRYHATSQIRSYAQSNPQGH